MHTLYHISKITGIKVLKPQISTHKKAYVYATDDLVTGLLFGAPHDDFDFIISEESGIPAIYECYQNAFDIVFCEKSCSVYEVSDEGFERGKTSWDKEFVCENDVPVMNEIFIGSLYSHLLSEESAGNLLIHRFENTDMYKKIISEHIVDRLIRFNVLDGEISEKIQYHYGEIITSLKNIMDGHLL